MYKLSIHQDLIAQHYLTVPNCGDENEEHSHHYQIEVRLAGHELNDNGYLLDIEEVERELDQFVNRYEDRTLNELPEFQDLNPSVEHFARILCTSLSESLDTTQLASLTVRIWEDEDAWASYSLEN